jgi:hypothetical protein
MRDTEIRILPHYIKIESRSPSKLKRIRIPNAIDMATIAIATGCCVNYGILIYPNHRIAYIHNSAVRLKFIIPHKNRIRFLRESRDSI